MKDKVDEPWELQDDPNPLTDVLEEIENLQAHKSGKKWIFIFFVSAIAFYFSVSRTIPVKVAVTIMGAILLHEIGHYLAMKKFGYRNLKIFFIPFFGGAAHGQNFSVTSWKKAIVNLAGPVPGIVLGALLYFLAAQIPALMPDLKLYILVLILINSFNLLPVAPLDGASFLVNTSAVGSPVLAASLAGLSLILMGSIAPQFFLLFGIGAAKVAYEEYWNSKTAQDIRNQHPQLVTRKHLDQSTIEIIASKLHPSSGRPSRPKVLASRILNVFGHVLNAPTSMRLLGTLWGVYVSSLALSFFILLQLDFNVVSFLRNQIK
jgi:Zn-dependent protease